MPLIRMLSIEPIVEGLTPLPEAVASPEPSTDTGQGANFDAFMRQMIGEHSEQFDQICQLANTFGQRMKRAMGANNTYVALYREGFTTCSFEVLLPLGGSAIPLEGHVGLMLQMAQSIAAEVSSQNYAAICLRFLGEEASPKRNEFEELRQGADASFLKNLHANARSLQQASNFQAGTVMCGLALISGYYESLVHGQDVLQRAGEELLAEQPDWAI